MVKYISPANPDGVESDTSVQINFMNDMYGGDNNNQRYQYNEELLIEGEANAWMRH